jgi:hypothetical protein
MSQYHRCQSVKIAAGIERGTTVLLGLQFSGIKEHTPHEVTPWQSSGKKAIGLQGRRFVM